MTDDDDDGCFDIPEPDFPVLVEVGWDSEPKRLVMMLDYAPGYRCGCGEPTSRLDRGYCVQWVCKGG
jgi:hypothetical protein